MTDSVTDMVDLIVFFAQNRGHDSLVLPDENGKPVALTLLFTSPEDLMASLVRGGWVIPFKSERSMLLKALIEDNGPMANVFEPSEIAVIKSWIDDGANTP